MNITVYQVCLAFLGLFLYHLILLYTNQQEYDRDKSGFLSLGEIGSYFKENILWGLISVIATIILLFEAPWIWSVTVFKWWNYEFGDIAYVGVSGLMVLLQMGLNKLKTIIPSKKK